MEKEIWRDIPGYEDFYQVSSFGKIKSKRQNKIMSLKTDMRGYKRIRLYNENGQKTYSVHRIVASTFIENPENKPEVNHKNKIKTDNRVLNLEWSTVAENLEHKLKFKLNLKKLEEEFSNKIKGEIYRLIPL
jgi:hypothetical protein